MKGMIEEGYGVALPFSLGFAHEGNRRRNIGDLKNFLDAGHTPTRGKRNLATVLENEHFLFGVSKVPSENYAEAVSDSRQALNNALAIRHYCTNWDKYKGALVTSLGRKLKDYGLELLVDNVPAQSGMQTQGGEWVWDELKPLGLYGIRFTTSARADYAEYLREGLEQTASGDFVAHRFNVYAPSEIRLSGETLTVTCNLFENTGLDKDRERLYALLVSFVDSIFGYHLRHYRISVYNGVEYCSSGIPVEDYWHLSLDELAKDPNLKCLVCQCCGRVYFNTARNESKNCPKCSNWASHQPKGAKRPYYL